MIRHPERLVKGFGLTGANLWVLHTITELARKEGYCYGSADYLAQRAGIKRRAFWSAVSWLETAGYLWRSGGRGRGGRTHFVPLHTGWSCSPATPCRGCLKSAAYAHPGVQQVHTLKCAADAQGCAADAQGCAADAHPTQQEVSKKLTGVDFLEQEKWAQDVAMLRAIGEAGVRAVTSRRVDFDDRHDCRYAAIACQQAGYQPNGQRPQKPSGGAAGAQLPLIGLPQVCRAAASRDESPRESRMNA